MIQIEPLTEKQAIDISIELWTWLAEDGSRIRWQWPGWIKYGSMSAGCSLCEYSCRNCNNCPYYSKIGWCYKPGRPYYRWVHTLTNRLKRRYAKEFLAQLKTLMVTVSQ